MSDLISRSAVIKALEECNLDKNLFEKDVFEKINAIPTAYDVEKVVGELDEYIIKLVGRGSALYQTVMHTVKKGGVDNAS